MLKPTASQARPSFPVPRSGGERLSEPAPLSERGFFLRAAGDEDIPWLSALYASTRAEEMAPVPWPEAAKRAFLDQQFELQHRHFVSHFPRAEFSLVEGTLGPIGRLYRDIADPADSRADDLIVDICFMPDWRNCGFGGALLRSAQASASARRRGLKLHVHMDNTRALSLYQRLGFVIISAESSHTEMRWSPDNLS